MLRVGIIGLGHGNTLLQANLPNNQDVQMQVTALCDINESKLSKTAKHYNINTTTTDYKELDTRWFSFEHEGQLGKARFVWSDTATITYRKNKVLCDHYRLDIIINDDSVKFWENSDYFMEKIVASDIVRQLWISRESEKRIIQASINTMGLTLLAQIYELRNHLDTI